MLLHKEKMSNPSGTVVDIVGIENGNCGHLCEEHEICGSVLRNHMVICLGKLLFVVLVDHKCLAYCDCCPYDVTIVVMLNFVVIMLSQIFCLLLTLLHNKITTHSVLRNDGCLLAKGAVCCVC